ncbi:MAG: cytochrome c oxidase subunit 3 [Limibaculum sp.]
MGIFRALMEKPWIVEGVIDDVYGVDHESLPTAKFGLRVFLVVATVVFSLIVVTYADRMLVPDWRALPIPLVLWLNTAVLILSSIALQWARVSADRERVEGVKFGLILGGVFAVAFLAGQLVAWRQLIDLGYFAATNPANAFFYLLTALHGLHLLGGLVAWARTSAKLRRGIALDRLRLSVELCAIYWHFLLVIWLVLFGLLLFT